MTRRKFTATLGLRRRKAPAESNESEVVERADNDKGLTGVSVVETSTESITPEPTTTPADHVRNSASASGDEIEAIEKTNLDVAAERKHDSPVKQPARSTKVDSRHSLHQPAPGMHHAKLDWTLLSLPSDVHHILATSYLDYNSLIALRRTCHYFHSLLSTSVMKKIRHLMTLSYLAQESEQWTRFKWMTPGYVRLSQRIAECDEYLLLQCYDRSAKSLRCYGCLELVPVAGGFVKRMNSRGLQLGGKKAVERRCRDCMRRGSVGALQGIWWKETVVDNFEITRQPNQRKPSMAKTKSALRSLIGSNKVVRAESPAPDEVGVCQACRRTANTLWWGCVGCFEKEEALRWQNRRQFRNLTGRGLLNVRRFLHQSRAGLKKWHCEHPYVRCGHQVFVWVGPKALLFENWGNLEDRSRVVFAQREAELALYDKKSRSRETGWRAIDEMAIPTDRREARCAQCWTPYASRRCYAVSLALEPPRPAHLWCGGCNVEAGTKLQKKAAAAQMELESFDGFGGLFDDASDQLDDAI